MYRIQIHHFISRVVSFLYRIRFWSRGDVETVQERTIKILYTIFFSFYSIAMVAGAITSNTKDETVFLTEVSLLSIVVQVKVFYLLWRKKELLELLNRICIYDVKDQNICNIVHKKLRLFMNFIIIFLSGTYFTAFIAVIAVPFVGNERALFIKIGFPMDYENDESAFWVAFIFYSAEGIIAEISVLFTVFLWYLMFHCNVRYVVLGELIKSMGTTNPVEDASKKQKLSDSKRDELFLRDFYEAIKEQQLLTELTDHLNKFLTTVFVVQLATSASCICASIYRLAFNRGQNLFEMIAHGAICLYVTFEIFMISYFGNEIKLGSNRLSYYLFESQWVDRCQSIKTGVIIFGEFLMSPVELVVLKLYSLSLATFQKILRSAYSMFSILKNFQ